MSPLLLSLSLACADLVLPLDESLETPDGFSDMMTRDTALYMLQGLTPARDDGNAFTVPCAGTDTELLFALQGTLAFDGTLDPRRLREVFEARYLASTAARDQTRWVKPTLAEFRDASRFPGWETATVPYSVVKRKSRRIFRSPEGFTPEISVSETLESETGDPLAPVRETEVALKRQDSDSWDFYVYDAEGRLAETSTFPAGEKPSPRICVGCHYDSGARAVSRIFRAPL